MGLWLRVSIMEEYKVIDNKLEVKETIVKYVEKATLLERKEELQSLIEEVDSLLAKFK